MNKKGNHKGKIQEVKQRKVDVYFANLSEKFGDSNKALLAISLILSFFGIMGLIWMIPFPQFQFLINMNMHTFLNWGSFFIAIVIYCYLKLAPTLSYAALFSISIMSFFIVRLEYVERDGGPTVVLVSSVLAVLGLLGLFFQMKQQKITSLKDFVLLLTVGPIWLWSIVFDKFKIKY